MLQTLGLSSAADDVYRLMLSSPQLGVAELCAQLAMSETDVRASLDELVRYSLVRESRDRPGRLRAVSPEVGLAALLQRQEEDLARRRHELAVSRTAISETLADYADLAPDMSGDGIQRLIGLDAIQTQLEILARELEHECLSVMPGGAQSAGSLETSRPLDEAALARGVSLLTLYQDSVRADPATYSYACWLTELGGQVRTAPVLPPRMLIFDRRVAVLPIDPAETRRGALCLREPGIVAAVAVMYEHTWDTAVPLGTGITHDEETGLTPVDRELLRLLSTGMTDEAAGRRVGLSQRTVRRRIASVMECLHATSRFEAGVRAAQRGWILSQGKRSEDAEAGANLRPVPRAVVPG
jgi:DNA-binding CsgD family transcriptional regulator/sugar-specific transcriptional regulator TrmB